MAAVTPCRNYPYPTDGDPPNVAVDIGALAAAIDTDICTIANAFNERLYDPGDIKASIRTSPLPGWLNLDGSAVLNAQTLYPNLWAVAPLSWKSGSTLNLPNMADRVLMDGGTLGSVGGANTVTLSLANMPAHTHTINHDHGAVTSGVNSVDHTHTINHTHASGTANTSGAHTHTSSTGGSFYVVQNGGPLDSTTGGTGESNIAGTTSSAGDHMHSVTVPAFSGSSGANSVDHTHSVNLPSFSGSSGSAGSGTAVSIVQSNLRVNFFIKT